VRRIALAALRHLRAWVGVALLAVATLGVSPPAAAALSCTTSSTCQISTAAELEAFDQALVAGEYNSSSYYFELTANIDMSGQAWTPIPDFAGHFSGQNHAITNLNIASMTSADNGDEGMFASTTSTAGVTNLTLTGSETAVPGAVDIGAVIGNSQSTAAGLIVDMPITVDESSAAAIGTIAGASSRPIEVSRAIADINVNAASDTADIGGLVGALTGSGSLARSSKCWGAKTQQRRALRDSTRGASVYRCLERRRQAQEPCAGQGLVWS